MKTLQFYILVCALVLVLGQAQVSDAAVPMGTAFTYQGRLADNGVPADGLYEIEFKLYDNSTGGNQVGPTVSLRGFQVTNGLFTVQLDFGSSVFNGDTRWLQIAVRREDVADPHTILAPRQEVTAVPYALQTRGLFVADNLDVGIGTTIPSASLEVINPGSQTAILAKSPWIGVYGIHNSTSGTFPGVWGDTDSLYSGAAGVRGKVTSVSPGSLSAGVYGINSGTGSNGVGVRGTHAGSGYGVYGTAPSGVGVYGIASGSSGTNYGVRGSTSSSTGYAGYFTGGRNYFQGRVGIGTTSPDDDLHVADHIRVGEDSTYPNVYGELIHDGGGNGFKINANAGGGWADMHLQTDGTTRLFIESGGNIGIGHTDPQTRLYIRGYGTESLLNVATYGTGQPGRFQIVNSSSQKPALEVVSNSNNAAAALMVNSIGLAPALLVSGTAVVDVLQITGADIAEKFPMTEQAKPGMVVAIDPQNPGKLCLSRKAYDHRVAGVVSGANDLPTGAILGNLPGYEEALPIALSGRVWVYCDSGTHAIEPGDLLTTSKTPGHAMKVTDSKRAFGAVLGKAMSSLNSGKGLVLVLVNLQ